MSNPLEWRIAEDEKLLAEEAAREQAEQEAAQKAAQQSDQQKDAQGRGEQPPADHTVEA
jgi:hypothetical protein